MQSLRLILAMLFPPKGFQIWYKENIFKFEPQMKDRPVLLHYDSSQGCN